MRNLSIIIPTFNRKELLKQLVISIYKQNTSFKYTVIVVVDGSTDGTVEMLKNEFPDTKIIYGTGNWWWTKSINEGLKYAIHNNFDTFLLMNDDTFIDNNFIQNYLDQYNSIGEGILGAISITHEKPYKIFYSGIKRTNLNIAKWERYHKYLYPYSNHLKGIHSTQAIPGRGMLFNLNLINKIGLFNETDFPQYYADYDFSYRAAENHFPTHISWDNTIYSYIKLTGKGNKTNSGFFKFILSFFQPKTTNSISKTYLFYKKHSNRLFIIGVGLHILRNIVAYLISRLKS